MSSRRTTDHQQAVARRLAELSEQLATRRVEPVEGRFDALAEMPSVAPAAGGEWWDDHTRVAAARAPLSLVPAPPAEPSPTAPPRVEPAVLVPPGRHASRRRRDLMPDLLPELLPGVLPETLRGRVRLGPSAVAVVAVLVAVGLAVTAWWVVRGDPEAPTVPVAASGAEGLVALPEAAPGPGAVPSPAPEPGEASPPGAVAATGTVTVDVAGRVRRPGIVVLDGGARVVDAVESAGGVRPGVDLTSINLARPLVDGEQILVGLPGAPAAPPAGAVGGVVGGTGAPVPGAPVGLVDLNLASQVELETLPQVGPVTAVSIIAWREEHGGFTAVTELLEVDGIGDATLAQLTPLVTV